MPFVISQNVNHETNPLDMSLLRTIDNPFPPITPVKPKTTAELIAANPRVQGHSFENETPYAEQWHLGVERQLTPSMLVEVAYVGSSGKHLILCYNPNEIQPGPGSQASEAAANRSPRSRTCCSRDPRNRSTFNAGTLEIAATFQWRRAVSVQLYLR